MLIGNPLPFVEEYIEELNRVLKEYDKEAGLTAIQRGDFATLKWPTFLTRNGPP